MRVARKSRSRTPRRSRAVRYAVFGAVFALFAGLFVYIAITGFALVATEEGAQVPREVGARLSLAASGAMQLATRTVASLARYTIVVAIAITLLIFGAVSGVIVYIARLRLFKDGPRRSSRSVRRKRRNR